MTLQQVLLTFLSGKRRYRGCMTCPRPQQEWFLTLWDLKVWASGLSGKKRALWGSTFFSVISEAFPSPTPGALRSPICSWRFHLEASTENSGRQVTSAMLLCLRENRPIYLSSPESEGVCICFRRSCLVSLGKAFRNTCSSSCEINLLTGIITKQTQTSPPKMKLWKKALHRFEFSQRF